MSTIKEQFEQAAAEAEAEFPEEEEQEAAEEAEAPEPDPEPEPQALSERDVEKVTRQLANESARHGKRVQEIMGADFDLLAPCPLCVTDGYCYKPEAGFVFEPLHRAAIAAAMGEDSGPAYKSDPGTQACDACDGWGDVLTGSKREAAKVKGCDACGGTGWKPKLSAVQQPAHLAAVAPPYPGYGIPYLPIEGGSPDYLNRPAGHPHYNMTEEYSRTGGLTG